MKNNHPPRDKYGKPVQNGAAQLYEALKDTEELREIVEIDEIPDKLTNWQMWYQKQAKQRKKEEVKQLYNEGFPLSFIEYKTGMNFRQIKRLVKKNGRKHKG